MHTHGGRVACLLLLGAVAGGEFAVAATDPLRGFEPAFETLDCDELTGVTDERFLDELRDPSITCGHVAVPADWRRPKGERIELAVYRLASTSDSAAPEPTAMLNGGPGQGGIQSLGLSAPKLTDSRTCASVRRSSSSTSAVPGTRRRDCTASRR